MANNKNIKNKNAKTTKKNYFFYEEEEVFFDDPESIGLII